MIILKHLTIERFRLLRSMNLHFPQRGSILIQGPNEAGKSALIESIYFALYGEPLASRRTKRSLDDLILYGAANAVVTLVLAAGATELTISRTLERGKGQQASLLIRQLGMPDEHVDGDLITLNERIVSLLGNLNGETLRDSGLLEQKALTRLETISGSAREAAVRRLQGLDILTELSSQFQVTAEDEERLSLSAQHLTLAEVQAHIPEVRAQLDQLEVALDAVQVNDYLAHIDQQEADIRELEQAIEDISVQRIELKSAQSRVQQLKKADATLAEIIASYDDIAEARRELPVLEQQIADLERREREDLPKIEQRVSALAELTRSFGTLQRMSNDLLAAVDSIRELEDEVHEYHEAKQSLRSVSEQIIQTRSRLAATQKSLQDLEETRRTRRPQLEERLQRLQSLSERLAHLRHLEETYIHRVSGQSLAEENAQQLLKIQRNLNDTEQEQELLDHEAKQARSQADSAEQMWRQLNLRRLVEEWSRLKGLMQGLAQAEQHVSQARQQQGAVTGQAIEARGRANKFLIYISVDVAMMLVCLVTAIAIFGSLLFLAIIALIALVILIVPAVLFYQKYSQAHSQEMGFRQQEQEAISRVGMMVTAREAAMRMAGSEEALQQVEQEMKSLGSSIPQTLEEAQQFLDRTRDQGDLDEAQQQMRVKVEEANAARMRVNAKRDAMTTLLKERARLEEVRIREQWDNIEENLHNDQVAVDLMHQEITLLAAQENLPLPSINARVQSSPVPSAQSFDSGPLAPVVIEEVDLASVPRLEDLVESTIKATEHEIVSLDGKLETAADLLDQTKAQQNDLDMLLVRQHAIEDRDAHYQMNNPQQQIALAREQQMGLRGALQSLQDSLRQRVKPLGVGYGQAAVSSAEIAARKQLDELHITLGNKVMLQERHGHYTELLKERQESLSEHYKQLAKFSNTLGSWIVPLNPFAEALATLRTRCLNELEAAHEADILQDLASLEHQEKASHMKINLCQQEITDAQEMISRVLNHYECPEAHTFARAELLELWPLIAEYSVEDREHLEVELASCEQTLREQEQQEQQLALQLATDGQRLDLAQTRAQMQQEERSYQTKKYGHLLLQEVEQRLLRKVLPRTELYMQQILPLLTGGRYHDVHLITDPEEGIVSGGPFQIQVWDTAAGEYIPTSALSGGASDLLSLALRLAFAIATLPGDLNVAPGFVLLDEPLSSFDRGRAQALVDVVTGDILSQHFEQIILLSHSDAFDPALFPYHLYMDNGLIVESNLPVVPITFTSATSAMFDFDAIPVTPLLEDFDDGGEYDATVAVAAIKIPMEKQ
ncbi:AAA family ATPase [Dictyobacter arantiisoli]|uniref:Nuclease SbcCD subunit C n=1 Tax=Dictyobacter arantiisoli TaxID=2014874 RepID=A0A5A5T6X3_9CHLR|nr:AAA family ATPase [Dictyobacter arantiisoli]GCF06694.1 hypothetical protein KDI_02580 [Dictyobacter arantiisoli]